jgi:hypothetical protein
MSSQRFKQLPRLSEPNANRRVLARSGKFSLVFQKQQFVNSLLVVRLQNTAALQTHEILLGSVTLNHTAVLDEVIEVLEIVFFKYAYVSCGFAEGYSLSTAALCRPLLFKFTLFS